MQPRLAQLGLGYASLETAAAVAGLEALVSWGAIDGGEVVLFDTGAGFKSDPPRMPRAEVIPNDEGFWRERLLPSLARAT